MKRQGTKAHTLPSRSSRHTSQNLAKSVLFQTQEEIQFFFSPPSEKIKTHQRTIVPDKKGINTSIDKFIIKIQFASNPETEKNRQCITRYIKNWADATENKGCSSLQTLYRFDSDVLKSAQLFIYRNRYLPC